MLPSRFLETINVDVVGNLEELDKKFIDKQTVLDAIEKIKEHKFIEESREEYLKALEEQDVPHKDFNPADFLIGYQKGINRLKKELNLKC